MSKKLITALVSAILILILLAMVVPVIAANNSEQPRKTNNAKYEVEVLKHEFHELGYEKYAKDGHWRPVDYMCNVCRDCGCEFAKAPYGADEYEYCPKCGGGDIETN